MDRLIYNKYVYNLNKEIHDKWLKDDPPHTYTLTHTLGWVEFGISH